MIAWVYWFACLCATRHGCLGVRLHHCAQLRLHGETEFVTSTTEQKAIIRRGLCVDLYCVGLPYELVQLVAPSGHAAIACGLGVGFFHLGSQFALNVQPSTRAAFHAADEGHDHASGFMTPTRCNVPILGHIFPSDAR
uniref:Secreted protein n=1 Tax=Strombidinopsis acuminata TaxID=141414 RepID=A0A7S3X356_9SPIT|mmetsp:Transcript_7515/g.9823  ORF Transcript_7515/g.9823 Transcript_7515/m.9823 type:complete len:138 (+) Transcript_7515:1126-1539(+)